MKERIKQIIDYYNLNVYSFSIKIGVSEGTIRRFLSDKNGLSVDTLQKISNNYSDINLDWLITGRGQMLFSPQPEPQKSTPTAANTETIQAIADERERTIQVLQDTNANLLDEIRQLRAYVNTTSTKYIQMVEQTLEAARQTNATVQQFQTQIGFHHAEQHHHTIAAHHKDKNH